MTNSETAFQRAHSLLRKKQWKRVVELVCDKRRTRLRLPFNSDANHAWYIVGDALYKSKKISAAAAAFRRAIRAYPQDAQAFWALGNCCSELGKPTLAERYFRKGLKFASAADRPKLTFNLGNALFDQQKYGAAKKEYKKIGKKDTRLRKLAQNNIRAVDIKLKGNKGKRRR